MMSPLSNRLTLPTKILSPRQKISQQHFAFSIADFLQNDLFSCHRTNAADGKRGNHLFDVFIDLNVRHPFHRVHQHFFGIGVLQTGRIIDHQPAPEGFVFTRVTVDGHTNVGVCDGLLFIGLKQFFGGLRKGRLNRRKDQISFDVFFAGDGIDQHQHFAVHVS